MNNRSFYFEFIFGCVAKHKLDNWISQRKLTQAKDKKIINISGDIKLA